MNKEGTGSFARYVSASIALSLCLLAIFSFSAYAQEITDSDNDGMDDDWESDYGLNSTDPSDAEEDPDGDDLTNLQEYWNSTDPRSDDTDSDDMTDGWEVQYGLDPRDPSDADDDPDRDGYSNYAEFILGSDPNNESDPYSGDDDDAIDDDAGNADDEEASNIFFFSIFFFILTGIIILAIGVGVYSKIKHDRILEHETRQRIVDYLKENPGAYYSQIRKDLDLAHGVLTHHINILEQQELLFSKQDRSYRRFFMDGMYRKGPIVVGKQKKVLDAIRKNPGSSQSDIGRKLKMGRMIVSYHINQLEDLGLVEKVKSGRENLIYPSNGHEEMEEGVPAEA